MLFIIPLEMMETKEKIQLLAQFNTMNGLNVLGDGVLKGARRAKEIILEGTARLVDQVAPQYAGGVRRVNREWDWDPELLKRCMDEEYVQLSGLSSEGVARQFRQRLEELAEIEAGADADLVASGIIHRAAKAMNIETRRYLHIVALQEAVFDAAILEQIKTIKERLDDMSPDEQRDLEDILREELSQMTQADRERIQKILDLDELSAKSILAFLKTATATGIAQMVVGGFGFGAFLFITTMLKAFSLLLGVTIPFGVYTAATGGLAFLLSVPSFLIVMGIAGGFVYKGTERKLGDEMAKILVVIGNIKLMEKEADDLNEDMF